MLSLSQAAPEVGLTAGAFARRWPSMMAEIALPAPIRLEPTPIWDLADIVAWRHARSWRVEGDARIPLSRGLYAIVDRADFEALIAFSWFAVPQRVGSEKFYAARTVGGERVWMHRQIVNAPAALRVDHRDGEGLNNRRRNLRVATQQQNVWNRIVVGGDYRGVRQLASGWGAAIWIAGKKVRLGVFQSPEEAAAAYDRAALKHRGEFARLNRPT